MDEPFHLNVAEEVRAMLARRRLSARAAASALGWSQMYMSRRISGKTPLDVNDLCALAVLLDTDIAVFLTGYSRHREVMGDYVVNARYTDDQPRDLGGLAGDLTCGLADDLLRVA